jgi:hypothetical protein
MANEKFGKCQNINRTSKNKIKKVEDVLAVEIEVLLHA